MSAAAFSQGPFDPVVAALKELLDVQSEHLQTVEAAIAEMRADEERRNKHRPPAAIHLLGVREATVTPWGVDLLCHYEYSEAEPAVLWGDYPCPGSPAYCSLGACFVESTDLMEMLTKEQIETIEQLLLEEMEC